MADLRFAAWFLWMTPLLAALSRLCDAARMATVAASTSPTSAASRNLRTEVFRDDLTALLRCRAFSFCLLRLIWDLIFATRKPRSDSGLVGWGAGGFRTHGNPTNSSATKAWGAILRRGRISQPAARAQTRRRGPGSAACYGPQPAGRVTALPACRWLSGQLVVS